MSFNKIDIGFTPGHIESEKLKLTSEVKEQGEQDSIDVTQKLLDHLNLIDQFYERLKAIDYLTDGAAKLAGNPVYQTNDTKLIKCISDIGGTGNTVDFELFKKSIDLLLTSYDNLSMSILAGQTHD